MKNYLSLILLAFLIGAGVDAAKASSSKNQLTGSVVKDIVERFVAIHYAQKPLDDELSRKIFKLYLHFVYMKYFRNILLRLVQL